MSNHCCSSTPERPFVLWRSKPSTCQLDPNLILQLLENLPFLWGLRREHWCGSPSLALDALPTPGQVTALLRWHLQLSSQWVFGWQKRAHCYYLVPSNSYFFSHDTNPGCPWLVGGCLHWCQSNAADVSSAVTAEANSTHNWLSHIWLLSLCHELLSIQGSEPMTASLPDTQSAWGVSMAEWLVPLATALQN